MSQSNGCPQIRCYLFIKCYIEVRVNNPIDKPALFHASSGWIGGEPAHVLPGYSFGAGHNFIALINVKIMAKPVGKLQPLDGFIVKGKITDSTIYLVFIRPKFGCPQGISRQNAGYLRSVRLLILGYVLRVRPVHKPFTHTGMGYPVATRIGVVYTCLYIKLLTEFCCSPKTSRCSSPIGERNNTFLIGMVYRCIKGKHIISTGDIEIRITHATCSVEVFVVVIIHIVGINYRLGLNQSTRSRIHATVINAIPSSTEIFLELR